MTALYLLIGISLVVATGFLIAFMWAVKKGQYDDDFTPSVRMLFDDETKPSTPPTEKPKKAHASRKIRLRQ